MKFLNKFFIAVMFIFVCCGMCVFASNDLVTEIRNCIGSLEINEMDDIKILNLIEGKSVKFFEILQENLDVKLLVRTIVRS